MNKKEDTLLQSFPKYKDNLKEHLKSDDEFAKIIGIHRITLYKIFSRKMIPSIEILNKIFLGLGYDLKLSIQKV